MRVMDPWSLTSEPISFKSGTYGSNRLEPSHFLAINHNFRAGYALNCKSASECRQIYSVLTIFGVTNILPVHHQPTTAPTRDNF